MRYKAVIFDLDGTLTDTLQDLASSVNHALRSMGMPERSMEEVRQFVGNGVRKLIERAVPHGTASEQTEECFCHFRQHYILHCQDNTCLYPGIGEMLCELQRRGLRLAIVSNKLQSGVDELYNAYFRDTVEVAIGERDGVCRKPAPDMVALALKELGVTAKEAVYVGDSDVDIQTASNSGLPCISVLWGFRDHDFLIAHGASTLVHTPQEIVDLVAS